MRKKPLWLQDMFFLYKYGFLIVYVILTICYIIVEHAIAPSYQAAVLRILIYTDPAGMGLFLMGALVLLEKSQRVQNALVVSPMSVSSYIIGKTTAFLIIGEIVAILISVTIGYEHILSMIVAVALASILYSLFGIILAVNAKSLNHFLVLSIGVEFLLTVPGVFQMVGIRHFLLDINPGAMLAKLMYGFESSSFINIPILLLEIVLVFLWSKYETKKSFQKLGGVKL